MMEFDFFSVIIFQQLIDFFFKYQIWVESVAHPEKNNFQLRKFWILDCELEQHPSSGSQKKQQKKQIKDVTNKLGESNKS